MKKLLKMTTLAALTFASVSAFAASQQAEELKKFQAWEEAASQKLETAFDAITQAAGTSNVAATEAGIEEYNKKSAELLAELDALGIKTEEVSPLIAKFKDYVSAEKEITEVLISQAKSPSVDNISKISDGVKKTNEKKDAIDKLAEQLEEKFPADE
ncbi:preprotein translocase [Aggregatibacter actinomycetemcomitans]|nr:preprotein translocase [Aggregatibacter actinomycetemcomitans]